MQHTYVGDESGVCRTCGEPRTICEKPKPVEPGFPSNHREAAWEDLHMQDISAGPVEPLFDAGYDAGMIRCRLAVQTCRAIAEGAAIMGDPETYPEYVRTMCRNAVAELEPPA